MSAPIPKGQPVGAIAPNMPEIVPTDLTLRESLPNVIAFLVLFPIVAGPSIIKLILNLGFATCASAAGPAGACAPRPDPGLWVLERFVRAEKLPQVLTDSPIYADLLVGIMALIVIALLASILGLPLLGSARPVLKVTESARPRTGKEFEFQIRDAKRAHLIAVHCTGRFTGYPGDALLAIKLTLPNVRPTEIERSFQPVAEPSKMDAVAEYVFDPLYFQFTSGAKGSARLWVGYGNGPECKMGIMVRPRG